MALERIGETGNYQVKLIGIFLIQWMVSVFLILGLVFFLPEPSFQCKDGQILEESEGGCSKQCQGVLIKNQYKTITSSFNLYCDHKYLRSLIQSTLFIGPIVGNILFAYIADRIGRKKSLLVSWGFTTIGLICMSFSTNVYFFIVMMGFTGFGMVPSNSLNMIIINEQISERYRQKISTILLISWSFSEFIVIPIALFITNWRYIFFFFMVIPAILMEIGCFFIKESPRFLMKNNQYLQLIQEFNQIAIENKKPQLNQNVKIYSDEDYQKQSEILVTNQDQEMNEEQSYYANKITQKLKFSLNESNQNQGQDQVQEQQSNIQQKWQKWQQQQKQQEQQCKEHQSLSQLQLPDQQIFNFYHLFYYKNLRYITIASCFNMMIVQMMYYGTQYSLNKIGKNIYVNCLVVATGELIGYFIILLFVEKIPRRLFSIITMIISNFLCLLFFFDLGDTKQTIFSSFIRIFNCFQLGILNIFVEEMYPTQVRALGVGIQMGFGLIGSTAAPQILQISVNHHFSQLGLIGIISIPACFLSFLLVETKGSILKDHLNFSKENQKQDKIDDIYQKMDSDLN